jgi:hypothetical protein
MRNLCAFYEARVQNSPIVAICKRRFLTPSRVLERLLTPNLWGAPPVIPTSAAKRTSQRPLRMQIQAEGGCSLKRGSVRMDKNSVETPHKACRKRIGHFYRSLPLFYTWTE